MLKVTHFHFSFSQLTCFKLFENYYKVNTLIILKTIKLLQLSFGISMTNLIKYFQNNSITSSG